MNNQASNFHRNFFEWTELLELNWEIIKDELMHVYYNHDQLLYKSNWFLAHPHYVDSKTNKAWKTYEFVFFGIKQLGHCQNCPKTVELLEKIPNLITSQFSVLEPYTKISPHKGFTKMVLRNHLALIVPSSTLCKIKVEDEETSWKEGEVITFDDSKMHEAWNLSDKPRMVLMIDVANPSMPYSTKEICNHKIENIDDPFLLSMANKSTWKKWLNQGYFDS